jgi:hypothetical protein
MLIPESEVVDEPAELRPLAQLIAIGTPPKEAATELGLTPAAVAELMHRPDFTDLVRDSLPTPDEVRLRFESQVAASIDTLSYLRDSGKSEVRLAAAKELLAQAGYTPVRKIQSVSFTVSGDKKEHLTATLREILDTRRG